MKFDIVTIRFCQQYPSKRISPISRSLLFLFKTSLIDFYKFSNGIAIFRSYRSITIGINYLVVFVTIRRVRRLVGENDYFSFKSSPGPPRVNNARQEVHFSGTPVSEFQNQIRDFRLSIACSRLFRKLRRLSFPRNRLIADLRWGVWGNAPLT